MRFKDKDIEAFWEGASLPRRVPPTCRKALFRKLQMLEAARDLADLRIPPSNRLESSPATAQGSTASG